MSKLSEEKVLRDPVHGYVRVSEEIIWRCMASREVQRLRRINQLGSTSMVYHTGEHSRFAHSLGVYEIVRRMVSEVKDLRENLSEYEKITVMLAGLLHDVGHAPFSHSFEAIMKRKHEEYTIQIITQDSEVNRILKEYDERLPEDVASVIRGNHPNSILCQLISSQLDADRMDYLLRDSYFTGTKYGEFDLERILRTMRVADDRLVIKVSGMHTIEDYIMARYHMYWQVYYHPVSRAHEALLAKLFQRLLDLCQQDSAIIEKLPMFRELLSKPVLSNEEYFRLDDATCLYSFQLMERMDDPVLADLAGRLLNRRLFESAPIEKYEEIRKRVTQAGYDERYYLYTDRQIQNPYEPYSDHPSHGIWMLDEKGNIRELSHISKIVSAICYNSESDDALVFYPKGV
ncbi:MAG: HD domain-containing protein [Erysipelotrichaceae bacterium]|nr:HD domain-containing protein [Erysipelotrichaceae bacterium]